MFIHDKYIYSYLYILYKCLLKNKCSYSMYLCLSLWCFMLYVLNTYYIYYKRKGYFTEHHRHRHAHICKLLNKSVYILQICWFTLTYILCKCHVASRVAQLVKNPPAMQKTWAQSLGWEDPQERGKATH